jgi:hypothetical protein
MNVAFLFNSDDPKYGGIYGDPIRNTVFGLGIVQASNRHMKVAVGDVLIYGKRRHGQNTMPLRSGYISEARGQNSCSIDCAQRFDRRPSTRSLSKI